MTPSPFCLNEINCTEVSMTTECGDSSCPKHSCHTPGEEGPFCHESVCLKTVSRQQWNRGFRVGFDKKGTNRLRKGCSPAFVCGYWAGRGCTLSRRVKKILKAATPTSPNQEEDRRAWMTGFNWGFGGFSVQLESGASAFRAGYLMGEFVEYLLRTRPSGVATGQPQ